MSSPLHPFPDLPSRGHFLLHGSLLKNDLGVGGGWRLVAVGAWRLVAVGGGQRLPVARWWVLGAFLDKEKRVLKDSPRSQRMLSATSALLWTPSVPVKPQR